jgi:FkbM family methyltransferase
MTRHDHWVRGLTKELTNGYFLEVGAYDGVTASSTLILEQMGWDGICVEPHPIGYRRLKRNRRCICDNNVIMGNTQSVNYIAHGIRSGVDGEFATEVINRHGELNERGTTRTPITLNALLEIHKAPKVIHYFALDVEGAEFEVLTGLNFRKYKVLLISSERNKQYKAVRRFLRRRGYRLVRPGGRDDRFVKYGFENYL